MPDYKSSGWMRALGQVANLGFFFSASLLVGLFGGQALDKYLGTAPTFVILGLLVGIIAGFVEFARVMQRLDKLDDRKEPKDG